MKYQGMKYGKMKCPDCFVWVPTTAKACQKCGHRFSEEQLDLQQSYETKVNDTPLWKPALLLGGMILLVGTCTYKSFEESSERSAHEQAVREALGQPSAGSELLAEATAIAAVKQRMKNPRSFELADVSAMPGKTDDGKPGWIVGVTYRGTNSFGGVVTSNAIVSVDGTGDLPLKVIDLE